MEIDCSDDEDQSDYGDHFVGLTDMVTVQKEKTRQGRRVVGCCYMPDRE